MLAPKTHRRGGVTEEHFWFGGNFNYLDVVWGVAVCQARIVALIGDSSDLSLSLPDVSGC